MTYVNLHVHSHYSLLDGFGSPAAIVKRAKEMGSKAVALTDHGVTYGLIELYNAAKKEGIKPILGCEVYVAKRKLTDKESKVDVRPYHLILLAKNMTGYKNLLKMSSIAHLDGFYYKPRIDYDLLKNHSEGLIALTACLAGHVPRLILSEDEEELDKIINWHIDLFGRENYFLEMQHHPQIDKQAIVNNGLKRLAKKHNLGLVVTNDAHYQVAEDRDVHDILLCIQTGTNVNDPNRMRYTGDFSMRDEADLRVAFPDTPEAFENTKKIADMCDIEFDFGTNLIPAFETPNGETAAEYLRQLCEDGLRERMGGTIPDDYMERLNYELGLVHSMGFDEYFLIVWDFVKFAKDAGIVVGPGRGSAAGAIIAWSLRITDLDPIHYKLFFERFLNPERISMPDIDIDFSDTRRGEVLDYVVEKYGRDKVAQIVTFGTMAPRAAIRDAGRALDYPYAEVDKLSKTVPAAVLGKTPPLREACVSDPELSKVYKSDPRAKHLLDYAMRLEGTVRHIGTHACAVIISEKPLTEYTVLQKPAGGKDGIVTQYSSGPLEKLGLLKMDFLGLRNLTIIETTCKEIKRRHGVDIQMDKIDLNDEKTFELLRHGDTTGVFQLESGGMRKYLKQLKPNHIEDIIAMGALYRPGPMEWIPTYIKGKHNPDKVEYMHESFKDILASTYGVAVYQEQILQLARDFAGFTLGEADILRKAVGKKIASLLAEQREKFVKGAVANGYKEKFAREVFKQVVEPFAGYGFNRAHAACYGLIAYQTAYLKAHYPIEFMNALLKSDTGNTDRVVIEIKESVDKGIEVLPPSINHSFSNFTIVSDNEIRFGLSTIKGVGDGPIGEIIKARLDGGRFESLEDFAKRVPFKIINKKVIQSLAASGAFDEFGDRNVIFESYDEISKYAKMSQQEGLDGQTSIFGIMEDVDTSFDTINLCKVPLSTRMQRLKWEKIYLGMYVSGHPLRGISQYIQRKGILIGDLRPKHVGKAIKIVGLISEIRRIVTKAGTTMAVFTIEDPTGSVDCVMFPKDYQKYGTTLAEDYVVVMSGKLDYKREQYQFLSSSAKVLSIDTLVANAKENGMFDENEPNRIGVRKLGDIIDEFLENESHKELSKDEACKDGECETVSLPEIDMVKDNNVVDIPKVFEIKIPDGTPPDVMAALKRLLVLNKGGVKTVILIGNKNISLPFGINYTNELEKEVYSILGG